MVFYSNSFMKMLREICDNGCRISNFLIYHKSELDVSDINYLTMRGQLISFLPNGKEHRVNDDGRWIRDGRQEGKPARVIRKLFFDEFIEDRHITDSDFEKFTNNVRSYVLSNGDGDGGDSDIVRLHVCNGDFIPHYYESELSSYAGGNLTGSCMSGKSDSLFELYRRNPNNVSMIVALDKDRMLVGRALLWNTNIGRCMDTIYAKDEIQPMFIDFAKKNGLKYKSQQSCRYYYFDMLDGENIGRCDTYTELSNYDLDDYPYMDTLYWLDDDGCLSNEEPSSSEYKELKNTDGTYENHGRNWVEDVVTGNEIDADDSTYVDYRHDGSWYSGYTEVETVYCSEVSSSVAEEHATYVSGTWYLTDSESITYVDRISDYMLVEDTVTDINCDTIPYDDAVELPNGEYAHIEDCVELGNGDWALYSNAVDVNGVWMLATEVNNKQN